MPATAAAPCRCEGCAGTGPVVTGRSTAAARRLLTIGEVARVAGVTASALRFYEAEGLVTPAARSSAGYRLYDAEQVDRVRFLRRAQRLGLTLAEVGELLTAADTDHQLPVREQLRDLVGHKIDSVRQQVDELQEFAGQLEKVHRRLGAAPGGSCTELTGCSCLSVEGRPLAH